MRAGEHAGRPQPSHPTPQNQQPRSGGQRLPAQTRRLLFPGGALVRRKGGQDPPGEDTNTRAGRERRPGRGRVEGRDGKGQGERPDTVLRVDDPGLDVQLFVRQFAGDRADLQGRAVRVVARGRGVRRQRVHMSGAEAVPGRHRVRGLLQHESQQVVVGEL